MLKHLFTSKARVKLLTTFLLNPDGEFFIRELTRKLDEQINSVRRELQNLKKLGLLKSRVKNRKKYYVVDRDFILFEDLRNIFLKATGSVEHVIKKIESFGKIDLLVLSGQFLNTQSSTDLLIVGSVNKKALEDFLTSGLEEKQPIRFSILETDDFLYRLRVKDKFIQDILRDKNKVFGINKFGKEISM